MAMRQAKPSAEDQDAVFRFLQGMESILEDGLDPDTELPVDEDGVLAWLQSQWKVVGTSWQRVLWAGRVAIDNACDPNLDYLEFKPEILSAMKAAETLAKM